MLEFLDRDMVECNPFESASVKKIHLLPYLNVSEQELGGNAHRIAETNDGLFLLLNKESKTIAVLKESEPKESFKCKKCSEEFDNKGKFLAHTRACKD